MDEPQGSAPTGADSEREPERSRGITIETCYRHPNVVTGVHCTRCGRPICPDCMSDAAVGYQCPECVREARRTAPRRRVRVRFILGRPGIATTTLIFANLAMFLIEVLTGASRSIGFGANEQKLFDLGAMTGGAVAAGQYWRLFTVMFLHIGVLHVALNCYALYLFGYLVEGSLGRAKFLAIYFGSGLLSSISSFVFTPPNVLAAGASGAIFGLLGAWVAFTFRRRGTAFGAANLQGALILIALNLALGFSGLLAVDNSAHIGGLVAGIAIGSVVEGFGPRSVRAWTQGVGFAAIALSGIAAFAWRLAQLRAG